MPDKTLIDEVAEPEIVSKLVAVMKANNLVLKPSSGDGEMGGDMHTAARQSLALVTNHIKGLDCMQMEGVGVLDRVVRKDIGVRDKLRQQLLQEIEEVSNADQ